MAQASRLPLLSKSIFLDKKIDYIVAIHLEASFATDELKALRHHLVFIAFITALARLKRLHRLRVIAIAFKLFATYAADVLFHCMPPYL